MGRGGVINSDTLSRQGAESASALNLARRLRRRRGFGGTPWLASLLFCMAFGMASFALCLLWLILDHHGDLAGLFAGQRRYLTVPSAGAMNPNPFVNTRLEDAVMMIDNSARAQNIYEELKISQGTHHEHRILLQKGGKKHAAAEPASPAHALILEKLYTQYIGMQNRADAVQARIRLLSKRLTPKLLEQLHPPAPPPGGRLLRQQTSPVVEEIRTLDKQLQAKIMDLQTVEDNIKGFRLSDVEALSEMLSKLEASAPLPAHPSHADAAAHGTQHQQPHQAHPPAGRSAHAVSGNLHHAIQHVGEAPSPPVASLAVSLVPPKEQSYHSRSALVAADLPRWQHDQPLVDLGKGASVVKVRDGRCETSDCRLLVTGCGRSGTHFVASLFETNGFNVTHERIGAHGSVSWVYAPPATEAAAADEKWFSSSADVVLQRQPSFSFFPIVHLTRHPLPLLASLLTCFCGCGSLRCGRWADTPSWRYAAHFVKFSDTHCRVRDQKDRKTCADYTTPMGRLKRAMEYYVGWNLLAEERAHYRVSMETLNAKELLTVAGFVGGRDDVLVHSAFKSTSKTRKAPVTWEALYIADPDLAKAIAEMAVRYGYGREAGPIHIL